MAHVVLSRRQVWVLWGDRQLGAAGVGRAARVDDGGAEQMVVHLRDRPALRAHLPPRTVTPANDNAHRRRS
eukprot:1055650-Rhodomonas_salina.1